MHTARVFDVDVTAQHTALKVSVHRGAVRRFRINVHPQPLLAGWAALPAPLQASAVDMAKGSIAGVVKELASFLDRFPASPDGQAAVAARVAYLVDMLHLPGASAATGRLPSGESTLLFSFFGQAALI